MADLHQPHDRLFRGVFSDAGEAASLLQAALPGSVRDSFDWTTLTLHDGAFVDEELQGSQSDLLYQVEHTATGRPVWMYLLFEHQSSPDPWMALRLLRYCCRIWEAGRRDDPASFELRPIVPVVFYQGARSWSHSTEFADLFPGAARDLPWIPRFTYELLDQTALEPEAVAGNVKGRIAQLLMMVAFGRHVEAALELAARWALLLRQTEGGIDEFHRFIVYLGAVQDRDIVKTFGEALERHGLDLKGDLMTYAEELLAEGRAAGRAEGRAEGHAEGEAKGEQRAKAQIVQGLLQAGVTWEVIEAATGLSEAAFEALKAQLANSDAAP